MNSQGGRNPDELRKPMLGKAGEIADIMNGSWNGPADFLIAAIRHRVDLIEGTAKQFLFAPELFGQNGGAALRSAPKAVEKGAIGIICTQRPSNLDPHIPCLLVPNVSDAVARLARYRRAQSAATFVAVTGSVGKSTTKSMIRALLSSNGQTHGSVFNYNAGMESVHFTLANLSTDHTACVAEFSEVGGLEEQIEFYQPAISLITNVQREHVQRIERQGYEGPNVMKRLVYLVAGISRHMKPGAVCILNSDDDNFALLKEEVSKTKDVRQVTFGHDDRSDVRIVDIVSLSAGNEVTLKIEKHEIRYEVGLPGLHMAMNSVAAVTAAWAAGINLQRALPALADLTPEHRRGTSFQIPWGTGSIVINDETVSSSVPSLRSTLTLLSQEGPALDGRRVAVLGAVGEIGLSVKEEMEALAREVGQLNIDRYYTIGNDIRFFNEATDRNKAAPHFQTLDQLERALRLELRAGDVVSFKGTRKPDLISLRRLLMRLSGSSDRNLGESATDYRERIHVVIGGDTYFGETYQEKRASAAELNYLTALGYDYSGARVAPLFRRANFAIVNLECVLTKKVRSELEGQKSFILRADPERTVAALRNLNIGGVLLGNNHAMDFGGDGLKEMIDNLTESGIAYSGAGSEKSTAQEPILYEFVIDDIPFQLAVISAYQFSRTYDQLGFFAGNDTPGVNNINIERLSAQVSDLKNRGYFVVVSPHWGSNYCFRSYDEFQLAKKVVRSGADLILGHGPHMMNEIARVDGSWVAYSLGNTIFNSEGEYERREIQPFSLIAEMEFYREGPGISGKLNLYPVVSCNQMTQFQPTFVDEEQFSRVFRMLSDMRYAPVEENLIIPREIEGRRCMTVDLF